MQMCSFSCNENILIRVGIIFGGYIEIRTLHTNRCFWKTNVFMCAIYVHNDIDPCLQLSREVLSTLIVIHLLFTVIKCIICYRVPAFIIYYVIMNRDVR